MRKQSRLRRTGQSMLELVAATTIIAITLVPALRLTRDGIVKMEQLERSEVRVALCSSKLEEELARTAASWNLTDVTGDFASEGRSELLFRVTKSDAVADGGSPDSLAVIQVTVWHDEDGGGDLDGDESRTLVATKLAKIISYEYEATIH